MLLELFLAGLALLLLAILWDRKPSGLPPGPTEIPFIGCRPALNEKEARELRDKYGSLVSQRVGNVRMVYVFDYTDVKDLFGRLEFSPRPEFFKTFNLDNTNNVGVVFNSGSQWAHGRRFILRQLRAIGMGTSRMENAVMTEARELVHHVATLQGQPVTDLTFFEMSALNVIWQLTTGRRYPLDAEEVRSIYHLIEGVKKASTGTVVLALFPLLSQLPEAIKDRFFKQNIMKDFFGSMMGLIKKSVSVCPDSDDYDESRAFINDYLKEMEEQSDETDPKQKLRNEGLYQLMYDLFNAGSGTVGDMLRWVAYYMARYPSVAARCQEEIDALLQPGELVTLEHRQSLPLVEAFTAEVLRHSSMILFLPQRVADRDVSIRGYTLPKGTCISTCTYLIHRDPQYWKDPDSFWPERFLDENGSFQQKSNGFLAFGLGRRKCVGEALARAEFFLFSASLLQNFHVRPPAGTQLKDDPQPYTPPLRIIDPQPLVFTLRHPIKDDKIVR